MTANANFHRILNRAGETMYEGHAPSMRRFVESLVARKVSFAGADLSGLPLNHLELDGLDLSNADLTRADLTGTSACGSNLSGALLKGVRADGFRARNARLAGADLSAAVEGKVGVVSRFRGADFSGADLRAAIINNCDMTEARFVAADMSWVRSFRTCYRAAKLVNAIHTDARYGNCDFTNADLSASVGDGVAISANRTKGARVTGGVYKGATIGDGAPAFKADANLSRAIKTIALGASALAMAAAAKYMPEDTASRFTGDLVGTGVGVVIVAGLANWMKQIVEDKTKEHVGKTIAETLRTASELVAAAGRLGVKIGRLCAVMADDDTRPLLRRALKASTGGAQKVGALDLLMDVAWNGTEVILCDRRRMAFALAHLHADRMKGTRLDSDLVILRDAEGESDAPMAFRISKDGGVSAVWRGKGDQLRSVAWDRNGDVSFTHGFWGDLPTLDRAKAAFESALWRDHGEKAPYLSKSHRLVAGEDGSVQILHVKTGRLNNPWGFAYLGVDGEMRQYRQGTHEGDLIDADDVIQEGPSFA